MKKYSLIKKITVLIMALSIVLGRINVYATGETELEDIVELVDESTRYPGRARLCSNMEYLEYKRVYIKNMYTGKYLDVEGGGSGNGTNVQQYEFNGTDSQKWIIFSHGGGEYTIASYIGRNNDNDFRMVLDINGGLNEEYSNANLWEYNQTNAQIISLCETNFGSYAMFTKCSNYEKVVQLDGEPCNNGANVNQYTWCGAYNQVWIFEPIEPDASFGLRYANYNVYNNVGVRCYPDLRNWTSAGNCANFVSQCMLASGIHYQDDWKVYRKNGNYHTPTSTSQLDDSWELCEPRTSPWISAEEFGEYWRSKKPYSVAKGEDILNNPSMVWGYNLSDGDVIQYGDYTIFGNLGRSRHTMYVTGRDSNSYLLTYHSIAQQNKNLLEVCRTNPNSYFVFYRMI